MVAALPVWPARLLDSERAHGLALVLLSPAAPPPVRPCRHRLLDRGVSCLLGVAAGFDKNAIAINGLFRLGFGFVEVGTVTPRPQGGNPRPRVFRLPEAGAIVNRMGFPGDGMDAVAGRLRRWRERDGAADRLVGVNIGPGRDSDDVVADFRLCAATLAPLADYLAINVSSPNTPGLRGWQHTDRLARIIGAVCRAAPEVPLLVKVSPDLDDDAVCTLGETALARGARGLIATNTTLRRPEGTDTAPAGGLSGRPLFPRMVQCVRLLRAAVPGAVIIGAGGIDSPARGQAVLDAGADAVQLYTALAFGVRPADFATLARPVSDQGAESPGSPGSPASPRL